MSIVSIWSCLSRRLCYVYCSLMEVKKAFCEDVSFEHFDDGVELRRWIKTDKVRESEWANNLIKVLKGGEE